MRGAHGEEVIYWYGRRGAPSEEDVGVLHVEEVSGVEEVYYYEESTETP